MSDETHTTDFAEAIRTLLSAGADMQLPEKSVFYVEGEDKGTKIRIPAVILDGEVEQLSDGVEKAIALAREERLRNAPGPDKREGTASIQAFDSFTAYMTRFRDVDSAIWADAAARKLVGILDYHRQGADGAPRWGKHRAIYPCPLSEAWTAWGGGKVVAMNQEQFAAFLDAHDRELVSGQLPTGKTAPEPSTLISIAMSLEGYASHKVKRERDPQTQRLKLAFSTESGFVGDVAPPSSFLIQIPVFQDASPRVLEVRLRVDVTKEGVAFFSMQIHAAGDVLRDAFAQLCILAGGDTGLPVFVGTPEQ